MLRYFFIAISLLIVIIVYTIWDNNQIKTVKKEILIENLPKELDGFTILQISDLHEKEFGKNQAKLVNKINSLSYDALVFTGDMLKENNSKNYYPYFTLIEGIENKDFSMFVPGNTDPSPYDFDGNLNYKKTKFVTEMEQKGVILLESSFVVEKGNSKVHFVDFDFSIQNERYIESLKMKLNQGDPKSSEVIKYKIKLFNESPAIENLDSKDVVIALTHFPVVDQHLDSILSNSLTSLRSYDLIIAGHYHGGQIRLPFFGALFVPEAWYDMGGLFPPKNRVKGLWEYRNIKQYVSTGLGSSKANKLFEFRLFNTPEINLLILKSKSR
ncbi:metallophosphoesterase [Bacillus sp. 1P02SD]|uniref:metallophosphoesterase n=1 Tax=Bacillus sp. 1P02SD TaxID=3132264 RepID=UPI0039A35B71